ncbi:hypothetical protein L9F63_007589, partial [Diploptera punctata]
RHNDNLIPSTGMTVVSRRQKRGAIDIESAAIISENSAQDMAEEPPHGMAPSSPPPQ